MRGPGPKCQHKARTQALLDSVHRSARPNSLFATPDIIDRLPDAHIVASD
jgi:hypothetical protein